MKISEIPMMRPFLCKHAGADWSSVFEVMKLGLSADAKAVYLRVIISGQTVVNSWRDLEDLDKKWVLFDFVTESHEAIVELAK